LKNALPTRCRRTKSGLFINTLSLSGVVIEEHNDVSVIGHMHSSDEARLITHRLIASFAEMVDSDLSQDTALYDGLLIHIKPLINRLNYQIRIPQSIAGGY
jgi:transcriptional antiterminator